jgi:hypothetical protein
MLAVVVVSVNLGVYWWVWRRGRAARRGV